MLQFQIRFTDCAAKITYAFFWQMSNFVPFLCSTAVCRVGIFIGILLGMMEVARLSVNIIHMLATLVVIVTMQMVSRPPPRNPYRPLCAAVYPRRS